MARHIWSVICYKGVLDKFTNNISLLDVTEELTIVPSTPIPQDAKGFHFPTKLALVSLWMRSDLEIPETVQIRIRFQAPDGSSLGVTETDVDMMTHRRLRLFSRVDNMSFRGSGLYEFVVEQQSNDGSWSEVTSIPLEVKLTEAAAKPSLPPTETTS